MVGETSASPGIHADTFAQLSIFDSEREKLVLRGSVVSASCAFPAFALDARSGHQSS